MSNSADSDSSSSSHTTCATRGSLSSGSGSSSRSGSPSSSRSRSPLSSDGGVTSTCDELNNNCKERQKKKLYEQKYCASWEKVPEFRMWLKPVRNNPKKAFCVWCKVNLQAKRSTLTRHTANKIHVDHRNAYDLASRKQMTLEESIAKSKSKLPSFAVLMIEASLCMFIADHCSVLSIDHLSELLKLRFSDSNSSAFHLRRSKCSATIVRVLAPYVLQQLVEEIGNSSFSLLLDESTDISVTKMLGVVVRFISHKREKIISTYLGLLPLTDGTANTMAAAVNSYLNEINLNSNQCIGIGTDGAPVMTGKKGGICEKLKTLWGRKELVLMPCPCHGIQRAVSSACSELPTSLEFLARETYNWFSHSTIRRHKYSDLYVTLNSKEPLKIVAICDVRWLSVFLAVDRIVDQYSTLQQHFLLTKLSEKCYTASTLYEMYSDKRNYCYLLFLRKVLLPVYSTNKVFESNNDPFLLLNDLIQLVQNVANFAINPTARCDVMTENDLVSYKDPNPNFGFRFEEEFKKLDASQRTDLRERCFNFLFKLIKELRNLLPENFRLLNILKDVTGENTLKTIKKNIISSDLVDQLSLKPSVAEEIETEWRNIGNVDWFERSDSLKFWFEVYKYHNSMGMYPYRQLAEFVFSLVSLPLSNADVERVFSQMNVVKTKKRNRMKVPLMNGILLLKYALRLEKKTCYEYEFPESVLKKIATSEKYLKEETSTSDSRNDIRLWFDETEDEDDPEELF